MDEMMAAAASFAFVGGLVAGSFVSVVAHRVPRGLSIVGPRSRCPACGAQIAAYDNIPVISWLLLRGRCRSCAAPISVRYPAVELSVGVAFVATVLVLFRRTPGGTNLLFSGDTQTASWTYSSGGNWPADYGDPTDELPIPIVATTDLGKQKVPPNSRLGLAVSVAPDVTPYALELMYDHPLFPSKLIVDTTTPLTTP